MNYIGVFLVLFLLRNIIIQHIKISHLQFLSDLDLTAWTQLAEVKDCWMLSLAWQTWTTVPGERIIIVMEQCEDTAILFTRPVVQVVGHLGREVEVLTALSLGGGGEDHVPDSPLVPLVQALVDLVHTPEGDGGHLLQGQHVDRRRDGHLPPGLPTSGQLGQLSLVPELDLDGHSVGLVVLLLLQACFDLLLTRVLIGAAPAGCFRVIALWGVAPM